MRGETYLTKPREYALVYQEGSSWTDHLLVVKARPSGLALSRYGISVGRRLGGAVTRNRVKRRLREILRGERLVPGWDIIFIARPPSAKADYSSLSRSVEKLLSRASLLATERRYEGAILSPN
ncbi:MAG: ribonuclease P protein component [Chloroflexota bacterium]